MKRFAILFALITLVGCTDTPTADTQEAVEVETDPVQTALSAVGVETALLVDVRTDEEWESGHFAAATHVPLADLQDAEKAKDATSGLTKTKLIYVHCAKGKRAVAAVEELKKMGFKAVALETTYDAIRDAGFEEAGSKEEANSEE